MPKLTEEMKRYISTSYMDEEKNTSDTIRGFGEKFGFLPSASTITKYQRFNENNPVKEEEKEEEGEEEGSVGVDTLDSRLDKDSMDISGDIEEADFERLCRNCEKSKQEMFSLLAEAQKRGYTKVNMTTGELEK